MTEHIGPPGEPDSWDQWWLSFADPDLPQGSQFLGVAIVSAPYGLDAIRRAWSLGINPGGSVQFSGPIPAGSIGPQFCDRLLTRDEAMSIPEPQ